jgi:AAA+ superfamily predicted ATPase
MFDREYDFASDAKTQQYKAGENAVFFVHSSKDIMQSVIDGNEVYLDNTSYGENGINGIYASTLKMKKVTLDKQNRVSYNGKISFDPDLEVDRESYFETLKEEMTVDFGLEPYYFPNSRLVTSKHLNDFASVALHDKGEVVYSNYTNLNSRGKHVHVSITPPTYDELDEMPGGITKQFSDQIRSYIFTLNALSLSISKKRVNTLFVMTPSGPHYPSRARRNEAQQKHIVPVVKSSATEPKPEVPTDPEVLPEQSRLLLDDIGGLEDVRRELKQVAFSFKHADIMKKWGASRPQGVLLYGPPGTGKTSLATALANEIEGELWEVKATDIYDKWLGNSEKNIENIFKEAKAKTKPTVLFLDEFDALIPSEDSPSSRSRASVVGIFKREMNSLREQNPNIIVMAATNHEDRIDQSLVRAGRFDVRSYVGLPDAAARSQIFANKIADTINTLRSETFDPFATDINMVELGKITDEMSGADITELIRTLSFKKAMEEAQTGSTTPITQADLIAVIKSYRK